MILELVLVFSLNGGRQEQPGRDRWFGADKAKHFFLSAFVQSASYSALRATRLDRQPAFIGASAVSATVSLGKEFVDRRRGGVFSPRDLIWDAAGIGAATAVLSRTK